MSRRSGKREWKDIWDEENEWIIALVFAAFPGGFAIYRALSGESGETTISSVQTNIMWSLGALAVLFIGATKVLLRRFRERKRELEEVKQILAAGGSLVPMKDAQTYLIELQHSIARSTNYCYLMFLAREPFRDAPTKDYWDEHLHFAVHSTHPIRFRRIITIQNVKKLEFVIEKAKELFDEMREQDRDSLDYKFAVYPSQDLCPPQIDVTDRDAFFFSPYVDDAGDDLVKVRTAHKSVVVSSRKYFAELFERLRAQGRVLLDIEPTGAARAGFTEDELRCWIGVLKTLGTTADQVEAKYQAYFAGYTQTDLARFRTLFDEVSAEDFA